MRLLTAVAGADVTATHKTFVTAADLNSILIDDKHDDRTVLMTAIKSGNQRIVNSVLDLIIFYNQVVNPQKFSLDETDKNGNTPLMYAANSGNLALVKKLMDTGLCDPTVKKYLLAKCRSCCQQCQASRNCRLLDETMSGS